MIKIYTASAGSGKTYSLVREYLCLAFRDLNEYKRIQAVTFTNKATLEMKERIIRDLYRLSIGDSSMDDYRHAIEESLRKHWLTCLSLGEEELRNGTRSKIEHDLQQLADKPQDYIQKRAKMILHNMLIAYKDLRVSTIDAFFQEVVRGFTRELNLRGSYQVELDSKRILEQASKAILLRAQRSKDDDPVMNWLQQATFMQMNAGKGHNPFGIIRKLSEELTKESFQNKHQRHGHKDPLPKLSDIEQLSLYLNEQIDSFSSKLKELANHVIAELATLEISKEMLSNEESGGLSPFYKIKNGSPLKDELPRRFISALGQEEILLKKAERTTYGEKLLNSRIPSLMKEYKDLIDNDAPQIRTGKVIARLLPSLGLIKAISEEVENITREEHTLLISSTAQLIQEILKDQGDISFLYEKIGVRINHFMIDEFQDTSTLQYLNFRPLLAETSSRETSLGDSEGQNLVVGDVKQSIYRWRGAESNILGYQIQGDFPGQVEQVSLQYNYRSHAAVVNFNNKLYRLLSEDLKQKYTDTIRLNFGLAPRSSSNPEPEDSIGIQLENSFHLNTIFEPYKEVQALPPHGTKESGAVVLHHYETESAENFAKENLIDQQLPEAIASLQLRGIKPNSIAILVRTKKEAQRVADILTKAKEQYAQAEDTSLQALSFDFVSDEALAPVNTITIDFILAILSYMINTSDMIAKREIVELYKVLAQEDSQDADQDFDDNRLEALLQKGHRGLYETIELIIAHYSELFYSEPQSLIARQETSYLIKFLDVALSYQQDRSKGIAEFIQMWRETAESLRLDMPSDELKIQILTIHKSKGLEYDAVLIPFLEWELVPSSNKGSILWLDMPNDLKEISSEAISYVPISLNADLLGTEFKYAFLHEALTTALDALNILYVATTRAKLELHLWLFSNNRGLKQTSKALDGIYSKIGGELQMLLEGTEIATIRPLHTHLSSLALPDYHPIVSGSEQELINDLKLETTLSDLQSFDIQDRIEELHEGLAHFDKEGKRDEGIVMHAILSEIVRKEDLDQAIDRAYQEGRLQSGYKDAERKAELKQFFGQLLNSPEAIRWFNGSGRVLNETPIIGDIGEQAEIEGKHSYRPDRIVIYPDGKAEIIDYKFGKPRSKHRQQVLHYAYELRKTLGLIFGDVNYQVSSYLWYISLPKDDQEGKSQLAHVYS